MRFDIDKFKRTTTALAVDDVDFDVFADRPLSQPTLRCLRYMHDVENHTVCYLRDLLLTPAHAEPDVTTFLTLWNYEEYWHGEALARVLAAHGEPAGSARVQAVRARDRRVRPWSLIAAGVGAGRGLTALHMTWGAINEWTTQAGYARLAAREKHPVLGPLLRRIMRQEGRHIDFYASQANERLNRSPRAQRITRFALKHFWRPVGSGVMPREETGFVIDWLFGDDDGLDAARRIDRNIDRLPGLAGLNLIERARCAA